MLIDAHTHLNTDQLFINRKNFLQDFEKSDWIILVNAWANNTYNERWIGIAKFAETGFKNLAIKTAIWRHPCDIPQNESDFLPLLNELETIYNDNKDHIVAIWECGIDLHFPENPSIPVQQHALRLQAELSRKLNLPLMIHSREWFKETMDVLKDFSDLKIYFHARWYGPDELQEAESTFPNFRIWCTNVIEYPSASSIREAIKNIKTAKILTETDAPFLPPQCFRGQQNKPSYVSYVYDKLCEILEIEKTDLENTILQNTKELYWI